MSQLDKIILIISLAIGSWGCVNNPIEIITVNGQNIISCNIDLIEETRNLKLSEIAEYCDVVLLDEEPNRNDDEESTRNNTSISDTKRAIVSEKYILLIERQKPAFLYRRDGRFIVQINIDEHQIINTNILRAQIDDKSDRIYLFAAGKRMYVYEINISAARNILLAVENTTDFFLVYPDRILGTFPNYQSIWGYTQSISNPRAIYLPSRFPNNLLNSYTNTAKLLNHKDKIILDFSNANDTSYYYNPETRYFTPLLHVYSKKNAVSYDIAFDDSPEGIREAFKKHLADWKRLSKQLLVVTENHYLLRLRDGSENKIIAIDNSTERAYFINEVVNDFFGNMPMDHGSWFDYIYGRNPFNNNGYLTFQYSTAQLRDKISNHSSRLPENGDEKTNLTTLKSMIEHENDHRSVLLICKLK